MRIASPATLPNVSLPTRNTQETLEGATVNNRDYANFPLEEEPVDFIQPVYPLDYHARGSGSRSPRSCGRVETNIPVFVHEVPRKDVPPKWPLRVKDVSAIRNVLRASASDRRTQLSYAVYSVYGVLRDIRKIVHV